MQRIYDLSTDTGLLTGMRQAKVAIGRNEVVVIPTDTVYGIAADAFSPKGVANLLAAKGRGRATPPPVLMANLQTLDALAQAPSVLVRQLAEEFWPGALTIVVRAQPSLTWDLGETKGTVALRIPNHKITLALLEETGPLAVSSANLHGSPAALTATEAFEYFGDSVPVYLDSGATPDSQASTIIDLTDEESGNIKVLRQGAIAVDILEKFLPSMKFIGV